jgi:hypothetical protein
MSMFIRALIGKTSNKVRHVQAQSVPFRSAAPIFDSSEELEVVEVGYAEEHDWKDLEGKPASAAKHVFLRLENDHEDMPTIHDCPCTLEGIKARLREKGPAGIPIKARAWLANILPPAHVDATGIGRGIPISARKAAEATRNRQDPTGGSRMPQLERIAQAQADSHARGMMKARERKAAAIARKEERRAAKAAAAAIETARVTARLKARAEGKT